MGFFFKIKEARQQEKVYSIIFLAVKETLMDKHLGLTDLEAKIKLQISEKLEAPDETHTAKLIDKVIPYTGASRTLLGTHQMCLRYNALWISAIRHSYKDIPQDLFVEVEKTTQIIIREQEKQGIYLR